MSAGLIDVNVYLSRWPLRRLPCDETSALVSKLKSNGVIEAWASSFDALLHKDIAGVNARTAEECARSGDGLLRFCGAVNPMLPDWEEDLRRCVEEYSAVAIRIHPNYHGYALDSEAARALMRLCSDRNVPVQIPLIMEDERMMHPLLRVNPVDTSPLPKLMDEHPDLRVMLLNCFRTLAGESLIALAGLDRIWYEISMLEGIGGLGKLIGQVPVERICFGSYSPMFYTESSVLKMKESVLTEEQRTALANGNATRMRPS